MFSAPLVITDSRLWRPHRRVFVDFRNVSDRHLLRARVQSSIGFLKISVMLLFRSISNVMIDYLLRPLQETISVSIVYVMDVSADLIIVPEKAYRIFLIWCIHPCGSSVIMMMHCLYFEFSNFAFKFIGLLQIVSKIVLMYSNDHQAFELMHLVYSCGFHLMTSSGFTIKMYFW